MGCESARLRAPRLPPAALHVCGLILGSAALLAAATAPVAADGAAPEPAAAEEPDVRRLGLADLARLDAVLAAAPDSLPARMDRLRVLYVLSVRDKRLIAEGRRELAGLAARRPAWPAGLFQAYRGAFRVLEAKHAPWPPRKLDHLKAGLPALDSAVAALPGHAEIRYLRLVSCYYLPFFIGRKDGVQEDFAALARALPAAHRDFPARWYLGFARFVLEKGALEEGQRRALASRVDEVEAGAAKDRETRP